MKDFFISYNRADKTWAEWIAWQLEEADYTTVLQAWDFTPGTNFVLKMHEAASEADRTIAVLSPDYLASSFTKPEWAAAFAQDPAGEKGLLIPIRVRTCDPAGLFGQIEFKNLVGLDENTAKKALVAAVKRGRAKPDSKPAFPPSAGRSVACRPRFPGTLPPIWNFPHRRNPNFTGREELLQSLYTSLSSGEYAALTQAMYGLGGVGKTQTAIEYAYRYANDYDAVLWVPAEDPAALASHFAALAEVLGLDVESADQPGTIAAVHRWLRANFRWLLVFDNAEESAGIHPYLPQSAGGHVIITSRNPEWRRVAKPLAVERFTPEEAISFLLARVGGDGGDVNERTAAAALAEELGGLALALEQSAAYMETQGLSVAEYRRLFKEHSEKVLSREPAPDYPYTVETVWTISFAAVARTSVAATELLALLAFFAPQNIPLHLIRAGADLYPPPLARVAGDELRLREMIRLLRQHSLVEVEGDELSVHRLVQAITRGSLGQSGRCYWAIAAIGTVAGAFPGSPDELDTWPLFSRMVPHASAASEQCEASGCGLEHAAFCLNETGAYLENRGDYLSAKGHFERAVRIAERAFEPAEPRTANYLNNLGEVQISLGDLASARTNLERALRIGELALGSDHPTVAKYLNNLGNLLEELGDQSKAFASYERALRIDEAVFGPDHPEVAADLNNLGSVLNEMGRYKDAESHVLRALKLSEAALGRKHPVVATCLSNLGMIAAATGDLRFALKVSERALSIFEEVLGSEHPKSLQVRNNVDDLRTVMQVNNRRP